MICCFGFTVEIGVIPQVTWRLAVILTRNPELPHSHGEGRLHLCPLLHLHNVEVISVADSYIILWPFQTCLRCLEGMC